MLFLSPEGAKLLQKYLGRTWAAFLTTALIGTSIGKVKVQRDEAVINVI